MISKTSETAGVDSAATGFLKLSFDAANWTRDGREGVVRYVKNASDTPSPQISLKRMNFIVLIQV
jgi:hypothetical protein